MEHEDLNIKEVMESRRHAVEESLKTINLEELKALTDELFPCVDHPWLEKFSEVVSDPASGTFHHAMADDHVHVLYQGQIIRSGGKELALELEEKGYDWVIKEFEEKQTH